MWIRKTNQETQNNRNKISKIGPVAIFIAIFILNILINKLGIGKYKNVSPKSWMEIYSLIPHFILLSFSFALSIYILQNFIKKDFFKKPTEIYICDKCNKVKRNNNIFDCDCGGRYYQIGEMKWVENDNKL